MKVLKPLASVPWMGLALMALLGPSALAAQEVEPSYGYFRTLEGSARLTGASEPEAIEVEPNYPVLGGDRVWVTPGARLEAVLPDGSIVRMGGGTDLFFDRLAASYDVEDHEGNLLRLFEGELQIVVEQALPGVEPTRIDTANTTIYLPAPGIYRLTADDSGWTELVVRQGYAEVATESGSSVVRANESAVIEGRQRTGISLVAAAGFDRLEQWGESLTAGALPAVATPHVAPPLRYSAAPLTRHGAWVSVGDSWAWRPTVSFGWRPYTAGRWVYTPAGITWVSSEPWGWVTSHYGSWDQAPGFGWVWYPGRVYSPAWVYWYWGPTHVAWAPAGFYTRYYGHSGFGFDVGFNFGVYGWAGGSWNHWSQWTFCPTRYFGHTYYRSYWRSGAELGRSGRYSAVPRGILTNDTRPLRPDRWARPREATFALEEQYRGKVVSAGGTRALPDVSGFVARRKDLASDSRAAIFKSKLDGRPVTRVPVQPGVSGGAIVGRSAPAATDTAPWRTEKSVQRNTAGASRSSVRSGEVAGSSGDVRSRSVGIRGDASDKRDLASGRSPTPVIGGGLRSEARAPGVTASPRPRSEVRSPGSEGSRPLVGGARPFSGSAAPASPRDGAASGLLSDTRRPDSAIGGSRSPTRAIPPSPRFSSPSGRGESSSVTRSPAARPLVQRIIGGARSSAGREDSGATESRAPTGVRRSTPGSGSSGSSGKSSSARRPPSRSSSSGSVQRSSPSRPPSSARSSSSPRSQSRSSARSRSSSARSKAKSKPNG